MGACNKPLLLIHGLLGSGAVLLGSDGRKDLPTDLLYAALTLVATRGRLGEDALDGGDAVPVDVAVWVGVHVLQPGGRQRVLLGRQLLVQLDEQGEHALVDLQDLGDQLGRRAGRDPASGAALGPHRLASLCAAAVDDLLELPPALCHQAEHLRLPDVLQQQKNTSDLSKTHTFPNLQFK